MKIITVAFLALLSLNGTAKADSQQSAGGWGLNCNSGNVVCTSGRAIGCMSTVNSNDVRSECTQHTGRTGWVFCATYDQYGNTLSQFSDQCP